MTRHSEAARANCRPRRHPSVVRRHRGDDPHALVSGAVRGDQRAWDLLVARYGATIRAVARRHRLSAADQEEVAQRTWLRLVQHVRSIKEPAALGGWLATTARNESIRVLSASRREVPVDEPRTVTSPIPRRSPMQRRRRSAGMPSIGRSTRFPLGSGRSCGCCWPSRP